MRAEFEESDRGIIQYFIGDENLIATVSEFVDKDPCEVMQLWGTGERVFYNLIDDVVKDCELILMKFF